MHADESGSSWVWLVVKEWWFVAVVASDELCHRSMGKYPSVFMSVGSRGKNSWTHKI